MADQRDFEQRVGLVKELLLKQFGRQATAITSLGRDSNNFVFLVTLESTQAQHDSQIKLGFGTVPLPSSVDQVVARISNPAAMLDNDVRIQNEVAAINLTRDALSSYGENIVPEVYGWSSEKDAGWIIESVKPGKQLNEDFPTLAAGDQKKLLGQLADVFKLIQSYTLPSTIKGYGGLGYDSEGAIVSRPITFGFGGPFESIDELYKANLQKQLQLSDTCDMVNGWQLTSLRERLEKFAANGIAEILDRLPAKRQTLVHGDFDLQNILYDPDKIEITGLVDYDFSHVASPVDEYFYSFPSIHGILVGPFEGGEMEHLRLALLSGNVSEPAGPVEEINWTIAETWNKELKRAGAIRPNDFAGVEEYAGLYWFTQNVCPPYFLMPRWVAKRTPEERAKVKGTIEKELVQYMDRWGF